MMPRRTLILLAGGITLLHFLATWFLSVQAWTHDWANRAETVLSFPGRLGTRYVGGNHEKLQNMALLFGNSVLWSITLVTVLALVTWILRRRGTHQ